MNYKCAYSQRNSQIIQKVETYRALSEFFNYAELNDQSIFFLPRHLECPNRPCRPPNNNFRLLKVLGCPVLIESFFVSTQILTGLDIGEGTNVPPIFKIALKIIAHRFRLIKV